MKSPNTDIARRLEHLVRLQFLRRVILLVGCIMIALGGSALIMTIRYTPEQLAGLLAANPKRIMDIWVWMPVPPHFRMVGTVLLLAGVGLTLFAVTRAREI
jgi:hypothetical protein